MAAGARGGKVGLSRRAALQGETSELGVRGAAGEAKRVGEVTTVRGWEVFFVIWVNWRWGGGEGERWVDQIAWSC